VWIFQFIVGVAFIVGLFRLYRRLVDPSIRLISSRDDYFSLILMIFYFAVAFLAVPNNYQKSEWPLILFFALTAFFLIYVPFSKIGHYLYYPFTRFFLGRTMGHRGVFAKKKKNRSTKGL
jgi:nitrate reductase gamma subunit